VWFTRAGHVPKCPVLALSDAQWHWGADMYFQKLVRALRVVAPIMAWQQAGSIASSSSAWVAEPRAMFPTSAVFRVGLAAFTKLFADEWAVHQVRMNKVLPGWIDRLTAQEVRGQSVPMHRYGTSEEVAPSIAFWPRMLLRTSWFSVCAPVVVGCARRRRAQPRPLYPASRVADITPGGIGPWAGIRGMLFLVAAFFAAPYFCFG
jgi:NAD(P)-dependent dehydrogenase (short-subunit alcohol dehydrogenase family)